MDKKLVNQLKRHEGYRRAVYECTEGYPTIGYGTNLLHRGISKEEAEYLLNNDLVQIISELSEMNLLRGHNTARQAVLVNMAYQLGLNGLLKFKRFITAYDNHNYEEAAKEMLDSLWAKQTPNRASELAEQMETGEFIYD